MLIRRLQNLPILYLLSICLLIGPAVTSEYAWGDTAENCSLRNEGFAGAHASDNYVENTTFRWGNSPLFQGQQSGKPLTSITPPIVASLVALLEPSLNPHRVANSPPRTPNQILHHRTIVLLI